MQVVILNGSCYSLPETCFMKPVEAKQTRNPTLVNIPKSELIRIGAIKEGDTMDEAGLSFFMGFEVRRL